ncbi:hypothetical protein I4U23_022951 [Adineta vaga]|nr:hypothetical protein I4U23_022951 [Adineta vaga]
MTSTPFNKEFTLNNASSSIIELISGEQAIEQLQKKDDFINNLSTFDLESRLQSSSLTFEDYFKFVAQHILTWDESLCQSIASCIEYTNTTCINQLKLLTFPERIFLILTNGKDENDAAYCRNENVIVIPRSMIFSGQIIKIFIHELFHIWSKWECNLKVRDQLYASIGFHKIPLEKQIDFPVSLNPLKITNPDAPILMKYYIDLKKQDDESDKSYKCTPILHASRPFNAKISTNMFAYLLATTLILDDMTYQPLEPLEYLSYDQASNFYDQIGENTQYTIHPEEILAENFVLWMTSADNITGLKSPAIVKNMNDIISKAVTYAGRRLFPSIEVSIENLQPSATYDIYVDLIESGRYVWNNNQWIERHNNFSTSNIGNDESVQQLRAYLHHDSPNLGSFWMAKPISFAHLKLTMRTENLLPRQITVRPVHMYVPRIRIVQHQSPDEDKVLIDSQTLPLATFIAVTKYWNEEVSSQADKILKKRV